MVYRRKNTAFIFFLSFWQHRHDIRSSDFTLVTHRKVTCVGIWTQNQNWLIFFSPDSSLPGSWALAAVCVPARGTNLVAYTSGPCLCVGHAEVRCCALGCAGSVHAAGRGSTVDARQPSELQASHFPAHAHAVGTLLCTNSSSFNLTWEGLAKPSLPLQMPRWQHQCLGAVGVPGSARAGLPQGVVLRDTRALRTGELESSWTSSHIFHLPVVQSRAPV